MCAFMFKDFYMEKKKRRDEVWLPSLTQKTFRLHICISKPTAPSTFFGEEFFFFFCGSGGGWGAYTKHAWDITWISRANGRKIPSYSLIYHGWWQGWWSTLTHPYSTSKDCTNCHRQYAWRRTSPACSQRRKKRSFRVSKRQIQKTEVFNTRGLVKWTTYKIRWVLKRRIELEMKRRPRDREARMRSRQCCSPGEFCWLQSLSKPVPGA